MLKGTPIEVVATSAGDDQTLEQATTLSLDAVLMDVRLMGADGIGLLEKISSEKPDLPVVMLSAYENPTYIARASALGAADYLLKDDDKDRIVSAVLGAVNGESLPIESLLCRVEKMMQRDSASETLPPELPLTPREVQVMRHIGLGLSNKEIAKSLMISVETVKEHVQNILRKAGANDRTDAAVRAVRLGLVD